MNGDSGTLKGYWARNTAVSDAAGIAHDMGLEFVRTLTASDMMEMAGDQLDRETGAELPQGRPGHRGHQGRGPGLRRPGGLLHRRPEGLRQGAQERRAPVHGNEGHSRRRQRQKHPRSRATGGIRRPFLAPTGGPGPDSRVNEGQLRSGPAVVLMALQPSAIQQGGYDCPLRGFPPRA